MNKEEKQCCIDLEEKFRELLSSLGVKHDKFDVKIGLKNARKPADPNKPTTPRVTTAQVLDYLTTHMPTLLQNKEDSITGFNTFVATLEEHLKKQKEMLDAYLKQVPNTQTVAVPQDNSGIITNHINAQAKEMQTFIRQELARLAYISEHMPALLVEMHKIMKANTDKLDLIEGKVSRFLTEEFILSLTSIKNGDDKLDEFAMLHEAIRKGDDRVIAELTKQIASVGKIVKIGDDRVIEYLDKNVTPRFDGIEDRLTKIEKKQGQTIVSSGKVTTATEVEEQYNLVPAAAAITVGAAGAVSALISAIVENPTALTWSLLVSGGGLALSFILYLCKTKITKKSVTDMKEKMETRQITHSHQPENGIN
ncbi:MAG: hypothetical protein FWD89_01375 [Firmicutes bacterium]|nr:hypothetical protein [Bacillota bacterium]